MELLAVFLPLLAFVVAGLFGRQIGDKGCQIITCSSVIVAAICSVILFYEVAMGGGASYTTVLSEWIVSGSFNVSWALKIDTLSVVMMCVINIVSACVHVYSIGYMSHDPAKGRFMAYLSLFTFAMLMLVTADNLLQLFFGWEGVGLASYLLIGFWNQKHSANAAAQKAFIVNRVGDFGLALGIMTLFIVFGSVEFDVIFADVESYSDATFNFLGYEVHALTLACLLLFMGAIGKSAQLGLHTWLPDAMEGPTPVSALIHAATMVTAGVFLIARMSPVFEFAPTALMVVCVLGACTAFVAATIGLTQFDIKRVIAYSTMSQLGYMFFALGVSAYGAAMFHLMTHAFFKALLFLGAGSVIHAMSDEQDMRNMGGIYKLVPKTYALMWIGSLALAGIGIPYVYGLSGFYSKDIVLEAAWADQTWFGHFAYWMGIAAAVMTAFYSGRLLFMTFHGQPRADQKTMDHVHESPTVMLVPLYVLAAGALFAGIVFYQGFVGSAHHGEDHYEQAHHDADKDQSKADDHTDEILADQDEDVHHDVHAVDGKDFAITAKEDFWRDSLFVLPENDTVEAGHNVPKWVKLLPLGAGLLGLILSYIFYIVSTGLPQKFTRAFKPVHTLLFNKWFFDEIYDRLFVKSSVKLGFFFWQAGDKNIIDKFGPDGSANASQGIGKIMSRFQSGYIYQYAFIMMISLIGLATWFFLRSGQ
ncbi:MAG: NADH-quinone oxidoreductase subunit L [Alphaproteobacteria bacterium]